MPRNVALVTFILLILGFFAWDLRRKPKVSWAVWIPVIWVMINGSRAVSLWFNMGLSIESPDDYLDGSPLDRNIFLILILVGMVHLWRRRIDWIRIIRANPWLFFLILYFGISTLWSEYPLVCFKRWVVSIGDLIMVLIILTDLEPVEALKALFRRAAYVLIPLSVLFIKYYPELGRNYNIWTWVPSVTGVTMNKNALGIICLVFGVFFFWMLLTTWRSSNGVVDKKEFMVQILILLMIAWLFWKANSVTSLVCFLFGVFILLWTKDKSRKGTVPLFGIIAVTVFFAAFIGFLEFDPQEILQSSVGRNMTLTGRTDLWKLLIKMQNAPLLGSGYETFWLGKRAEIVWEMYWWHPNQAHNGYLDTYLNLGMIGLFLLGATFACSYRSIRKAMTHDCVNGSLRMAFLPIVAFYNITESAFKGRHLIWFVFLLISLDLSSIFRSESSSGKISE